MATPSYLSSWALFWATMQSCEKWTGTPTQSTELCALMRNVISTNLACNMCVHDQAKSSYHVYAHKSLKFVNIFKTYRWGLSFFEVFTYTQPKITYIHIHTRPSWFVRVKFSLSLPHWTKSWVRCWIQEYPVDTLLLVRKTPGLIRSCMEYW